LRNDILRNPNVGKILMIRKDDMKLFGIAVYKERKDQDNNIMELLFFCSRYSGTTLGMRLLQTVIKWAEKKKFYSEIVAMADINVIKFFLKNEFVLIDRSEFEK
jgi:GNAT superfamily N-acetyltransferase